MKKKFSIKRIFSVMMAFLLTMVAALPVMAEPESKYTIKITPDTTFADTSASAANRFQAYQIFSGDISTENPSKLANIKWGNGVNPTAFVEALKADKELGETFTEALKNVQTEDLADAVARVLELNKDNSSFLDTFAIVAAANKNEMKGESQLVDGEFVITVDSPGYYLIIDAYTPPETPNTDVVSKHILDVLGDRTIDMKAEAPKVDKKIVKDNKENDGASFEIGDAITFRLKGTVSEFFRDFVNSYEYSFVDTLCSGLTYVENSVKVSAYSVNEDGSLNAERFVINDSLYSVSYDGAKDGEHTLKVYFADLKAVKDLTKDDMVVVEYKATLNENAQIGEPQENKVHLEYSNNPYVSGTGETGNTPDEKVFAYTFGLDITKTDGVDKSINLDGVGFKLYKKADGGAKQYATFDQIKTTASGEKVYTVKAEEWQSSADAGQEIKTADGGKLYIEGLAEGTYFLEETSPADGYKKMKDIEIEISSLYYMENDDEVLAGTKSAGELKSVTVTIKNDRKDVVVNGEGRIAGSTDLTLYNIPSTSILPNTGGIGTVIFYVLGGLLLAGAAAFLIISKSKKNAEKQ